MSAILEFYFRFRLRSYHCIRHAILHQTVEFHPNRTIFGKVMMLYRFSRRRPLRRNSTSGFRSADVALFGRSVQTDLQKTAPDYTDCTSLPNFIQIGPPTEEKWRHVDFQNGGSTPSWI